MARKGGIIIHKDFYDNILVIKSGNELVLDEDDLDDLLVAIHNYKIEQAVEKLRDEVDEGISNLTIGRR